MVDWTSIPGIREGNGINNVFLGLIYIVVILGVIGAAAGPTDDPGESSPDLTPTPSTGGSTAATPTATPQASSPPPTSTLDYIGEFELLLKSETGQIDVDHLSEDQGVVFLEYRTIKTTRDGLADEMGRIAGTYAVVVDRGWRPDSMEVTILGANGTPIGFWRVRTAWAVAYNDGEITGEEYSIRILQTLEVNQ